MEDPKISIKHFGIKWDNADNNNVEKILIFFCRKIYFKNKWSEYLRHDAAAKHAFGITSDTTKVKVIVRKYRQYFDIVGEGITMRFRPDYSKLRIAFPEIWGEVSNPHQTIPLIENAITALEEEYEEYKNNFSRSFISIKPPEFLGEIKNQFVYRTEILIGENDYFIQLAEGIKVKYRDGEYSTYVSILEFNSHSYQVIFQSDSKIRIYDYGRPQLQNSPAYLINNVIERLKDINFENLKLKGIFHNPIESISYPTSEISFKGKLEVSQVEALNFTQENSISFIWGPPGTGKSYAIAHLLLTHYLQNEKTLVCSIANVAVDVLAKLFVNVVHDYERIEKKKQILQAGEILRIGHSKDKEMLKIKELFPSDKEIESKRNELLKEEEVLAEFQQNEKKYGLQLSKISRLRDELKELLIQKIQNSRVVFTTVTKAILEKAISEQQYDNLVIDEASMLSIPYLIGLLKNINKRVIIVGDFMQLNPIALSVSSLGRKMLGQNVFQMLGNDNEEIMNHPQLKMLKEQRRCAKQIIDLVNKEFYNNELKTIQREEHSLFKSSEFGEENILFINLNSDNGYEVRFNDKSRFNLGSLAEARKVLKKFLKCKELKSIGIITPYAAQAREYKRLISEFEEIHKPHFTIEAGTIHSFQGSEKQVIIFDMVDSITDFQNRKIEIGKLYQGNDGESLLNVAVTRAISKLIIIGSSTVFRDGKDGGLVSRRTKSIIDRAHHYAY